MLKNITIPASATTTNVYYNKLVAHYDLNIANRSSNSENYNTSATVNTNSTDNPFDTLLSTVPNN